MADRLHSCDLLNISHRSVSSHCQVNMVFIFNNTIIGIGSPGYTHSQISPVLCSPKADKYRSADGHSGLVPRNHRGR